jgi:hypothetical protein
MGKVGIHWMPPLMKTLVETCDRSHSVYQKWKGAPAPLESKRLPDGGFPAEASYARTNRPQLSGYSPIKWGGTSKKTMNPFVTADAFYVLKMAGCLPEAV